MRSSREVVLVLAVVALLSLLVHRSTPPAPPSAPEPCPAVVLKQHQQLSERNDSEATQAWFPGRRGNWAVLSYHVARDGSVQDVTVHSSSGPGADAERIAGLVRGWAPVDALPEGVDGLEVTELFWRTTEARFYAGSLESQLAELDDGRWIRVSATR